MLRAARRRRAAHRRPVRRGQGARRRLRRSSRRRTSTRRSTGDASWPASSHPADRGAAVPVTARPIERVFREHYGRAVAVLVRLLGDIDAAEEAVQDAFVTAVAALAGRRRPAQPGRAGSSRPPATGPSTGCGGRAPARTGTPRPRCLHAEPEPAEEGPVPDDRLRLIFTCCHPALAVRRAGRADPAAARRPDHGGDRVGVPRARADDGAAAGAGEGARSATPASRTGCRPRPSCPTGCARCSPSST